MSFSVINTMNTEILGVKIDNATFDEVLDRVDRLVGQGRGGKPQYIVKPNPEIVTYAQKDQDFKRILNEASLAPPDGIGLMIASRILGKPLKEGVGGPELMEAVLKLAQERDYSVYFFGAKPLVVEKLVEVIKNDYSNLKIAGFHHGYIGDDKVVLEDVKKAKPDILFVAMGFPKQEKWIKKNLNPLSVPLMIAEGGSFDFVSGEIARAPVWMRKVGLEWFYRLIRQPARIRRQVALPKFLWLVLTNR